SEAEMLRIDVCDRGPGIAEADRHRVFDRFYAADRGDRSGAGTGLGLTICQGIVTAHGGQVEALPGDDGVGATIRISLPLVAPPTDAPRDD
ncbi:MAG: HAMP domain-containing histidine kinase, partial [Arenimonas sp.]|nr:HAMP domain-containing histidine kinase [Arenimonas sp.]